MINFFIQQKLSSIVSTKWIDIVRTSESEDPKELLEMHRKNNPKEEFRLVKHTIEVIEQKEK